jgi:mono/diheme cytochrome c family protein
LKTLFDDRKPGGWVRVTHLGLALSVGLIAAVGCKHSPAKTARPFTPREAAGQQVFARQCSSCHYADTDEGLQGPGLAGVFRKPYLPSGAVANDTRVSRVIEYGRGMMPPLGNNLSDEDLQNLMAYLHTL